MWQLVFKFCYKRTTFDKITVKILKNDNGINPKFADPRVAAVSRYFKRSVAKIDVSRAS